VVNGYYYLVADYSALARLIVFVKQGRRVQQGSRLTDERTGSHLMAGLASESICHDMRGYHARRLR
jgi:hypothetical protein